FSLVRRVIDEPGRELPLDRDPGGLGRPLGDELLEPTRIYALDCLALAAACDVHAFAHITGGGLAAHPSRALPPGAGATLARATGRRPPVFGVLARHGGIADAEMERVLNMGIGMIAVTAPDAAAAALDLLAERGVPAWAAGQVTTGPGKAELT